MGIEDPAVTAIQSAIRDDQRSYAWLAREAGVPYKRILAEVKHGTRPLSFDVALAAFSALNLDIRAFIGEAVAA